MQSYLFKCLQCSKYLPNSCSVPSKFIFQCNLENAVLANMNILKKFMKAKSACKKDNHFCISINQRTLNSCSRNFLSLKIGLCLWIWLEKYEGYNMVQYGNKEQDKKKSDMATKVKSFSKFSPVLVTVFGWHGSKLNQISWTWKRALITPDQQQYTYSQLGSIALYSFKES